MGSWLHLPWLFFFIFFGFVWGFFVLFFTSVCSVQGGSGNVDLWRHMATNFQPKALSGCFIQYDDVEKFPVIKTGDEWKLVAIFYQRFYVPPQVFLRKMEPALRSLVTSDSDAAAAIDVIITFLRPIFFEALLFFLPFCFNVSFYFFLFFLYCTLKQQQPS